MIERLPQELRSGIVPRILNWFLTTSNMPAHAIDPRTERLDTSDWEQLQSAVRSTAYRTPYTAIGSYMDRWWYLPEIFGERARVHRIRRSDHGRDLHDHPWHFVSVILDGGYTEEIEIIPGSGITDRRRFRPGDVLFRHAEHRHRLDVEEGEECWSLIFTSQNVREWGFWTTDGFVPWQRYEQLEPA